MRITITLEGSAAEAAALVETLHTLFGDRVTVALEETGDSGAAVPEPAPLRAVPLHAAPETPVPVSIVAETAATAATAAATAPAAPEPARPPGRGQLFQDAQLAAEPVAYGEGQAGPPAWRLRDFAGESRPGGEAQAVRSALLRPDAGYPTEDAAPEDALYLNPAYASTALAMGGAFRTLSWELGQADVVVRAGYACALEAVFHPLVMTRAEDGRLVALGQELAADWAAQLAWRWVVRGADGQELAADEWRDGATLGRADFALPLDQPHTYRWRWQAAADGALTFALQFRNTWALAQTRVLLHQATCVEA